MTGSSAANRAAARVTAPARGSVEVMAGSSPSQLLRRRENTRARLLAAAEEVFAAKGIRRVTVDDLVGAAGFTRGAFYSNFSSIDEVFYALFRAQSEAMIDTVRAVIDGTTDEEFSIGLILDRLRPLSQRWHVIQTEFTLLALRSEEARAIFRQHHALFEDQMCSLIVDMLDRLGRAPAIPISQLAETAIALYLHALTQEGLGIETLDIDELTGTVLPQVLLGLSREK